MYQKKPLQAVTFAGRGNWVFPLFRAGIDPRSPADAVAREAAAPLLEALQDVLRLSIEQCGSSIRDYRDANGNVAKSENLNF